MSSVVFGITGGDFAGAGAASSGLKDLLKRIGVEPAALRRAMIAAYEAEMNVVIHAYNGKMRANLADGVLEVEVADEGPGIPDVGLAMTEGYSTASAEARELGFGAGLGLPNIRKNSDRFEIETVVGEGTKVRFAIRFSAQGAAHAGRNSLGIAGERCRQCLRCLAACPTGALRVRRGQPLVLDHLCFDCGACIAACEAGALTIEGSVAVPDERAGAVLVVPGELLAQFGPGATPAEVLGELSEMGFAEVRVTEGWKQALREAVTEYAREEARVWPVISPVCPAVVSLVETRYPSLIGHLAPFLSPVEAAAAALMGRAAVLVAGCPARRSALMFRAGHASATVIAPQGLLEALLRRIGERRDHSAAASCGRGVPAPRPRAGDGPPTAAPLEEPVQVTGVRHVVALLERAEDGLLRGLGVVEPFACDGGCFGSPLLREDSFVARWRSLSWPARLAGEGKAFRREKPYAARAGLRLDPDMGRAIEKLAEMDRVAESLPGRDCGACGAPTCRALAEDVVLRRAERSLCIHLPKGQEKTP